MPIELKPDLTFSDHKNHLKRSARRFDYSQTSRIPVPIELKPDLTFLDPIIHVPFETACETF